MGIRIEGIYDPPTPEGGERILVDGIWRRGISEQQAHLDGWLRTLAAGKALRQWLDQDPARWDALEARYFAGLDIKRDGVDVLVPRARTKRAHSGPRSMGCESAMAARTARDLLNGSLGPIRPILAREAFTDLCINGPGLLFVQGAHGWERMPADNITDTCLHSVARAVASFMSGTVSERAPILSGHLPTGERIQIVLPPAAEEPRH